LAPDLDALAPTCDNDRKWNHRAWPDQRRARKQERSPSTPNMNALLTIEQGAALLTPNEAAVIFEYR
jgi:hypothetical protein